MKGFSYKSYFMRIFYNITLFFPTPYVEYRGKGNQTRKIVNYIKINYQHNTYYVHILFMNMRR